MVPARRPSNSSAASRSSLAGFSRMRRIAAELPAMARSDRPLDAFGVQRAHLAALAEPGARLMLHLVHHERADLEPRALARPVVPGQVLVEQRADAPVVQHELAHRPQVRFRRLAPDLGRRLRLPRADRAREAIERRAGLAERGVRGAAVLDAGGQHLVLGEPDRPLRARLGEPDPGCLGRGQHRLRGRVGVLHPAAPAERREHGGGRVRELHTGAGAERVAVGEVRPALHRGREDHGAARPAGAHRLLVDGPRLARRELRQRPVERDVAAPGRALGVRGVEPGVLRARHRGELEAEQPAR